MLQTRTHKQRQKLSIWTVEKRRKIGGKGCQKDSSRSGINMELKQQWQQQWHLGNGAYFVIIASSSHHLLLTELAANGLHGGSATDNVRLQIQILLKSWIFRVLWRNNCIHKLQPSFLSPINKSITKWRLSAPGIQELPLLAASSLMRLLPWLANPGNSAMSPHAQGKKGTHHNDIIYSVKTSQGREGTTQKLR